MFSKTILSHSLLFD